MRRMSLALKATSMRLRWTIQLLQQADAEYRLGNETEFQSLVREASATFRSIAVTIPIGNGSVSTTLDTTLEPPMPYGTETEESGRSAGTGRRTGSH